MQPAKPDQLHIRTSGFQKAKLAEAAKARNMNVSQFVLQVSLEAAEEILADQTSLILSPEAFAEFCELLDEPPRMLSQLQEQLKKGSIFK